MTAAVRIDISAGLVIWPDDKYAPVPIKMHKRGFAVHPSFGDGWFKWTVSCPCGLALGRYHFLKQAKAVLRLLAEMAVNPDALNGQEMFGGKEATLEFRARLEEIAWS